MKKSNRLMIYYVLIIVIVIVVLVFFLKPYIDSFESFETNNIMPKELSEIESIAPKERDKIYGTVQELIDENPTIRTDDNCIVSLINGESGFGSQITLIAQKMSYLYLINPSLVIIPCFNNNNIGFKYSEEGYPNSFFLYFKMKKNLKYPLSSYKIYFVDEFILTNHIFVDRIIPPINSETNRHFIMLFNESFEYIPNLSIQSEIQKLKRPLIGIHIRSLQQKKIENPDYLSISMNERLKNLKEIIKESDYSLFIMTDVDEYIQLAKKIFDKPIYYIENINRIPTGDVDSMPSMSKMGYELGADILNECYAMSLCDKVYVSFSNIPLLITIMNPGIYMVDY